MRKAILLHPNYKVEVIDFVGELDWYYKHLDCDLIELVYVGEYALVLDEEGLLKQSPEINVMASLIYGSPLYGKVMVVKDDEPDLIGLNEEEFNEFNNKVLNLLDEFDFRMLK